MRFRALVALITTCIIAEVQPPSFAGGSSEHQSDIEITWDTLKPIELPLPEVSQFQVLSGFRIQKFAENAGNARILAIGPNGNVCVTRREEGDILMSHIGDDVKTTLADLLPPLQYKTDRSFLTDAHRRTQDWVKHLDRVERVERSPLRGEYVFAARHLRLHEGQRMTSPRMLAAMASRLPLAIAVQFRVFESAERGIAFARVCGTDGFRYATPAEVRPALASALRSPRTAIVEAVVDPDKPPANPVRKTCAPEH